MLFMCEFAIIFCTTTDLS